MPIAIFLITVIVATTLSLTTFRITDDARMNQQIFASNAAFFAAESAADLALSNVSLKKSADLSKNFLSLVSNLSGQNFLSFSSSFSQKTLELNHGIELSSRQSSLSIEAEPLIENYFQSGAEVFLYDIPLDKAVQFIRVDCGLVMECPELIVEWFEFKKNFHFQDLKTLKNLSFDTTPFSFCLDYSTTIGMKRCALRTSWIGTGDFSIKNGGTDPPYKKLLRLATRFETGAHYLFRFRSVDLSAFDFRIMGEKNGKTVPLPMMNLSADQSATALRTARRVQEQRQISSGLQDGLEFAHWGEEVMNK